MFLVETTLNTAFGTFRHCIHQHEQSQVTVLIMGDVQGAENVLCRLHSACQNGHYFNSTECDCADQMAAAQKIISEAGKGIILLLDQEGKGNGYLALLLSKRYKEAGMKQSEAYLAAGYVPDARTYNHAALVLHDLQVKSIVLLSEGTAKSDGLKVLGITVSETRPCN
jgi:GTP cyclohydrolase II